MTDLFQGVDEYRQRTSLFPHPAVKEMTDAFHKAQIKVKECSASPLSPMQTDRINQADQAVRSYLQKFDEALKASRKSTLHFVTSQSDIKIQTNNTHTR